MTASLPYCGSAPLPGELFSRFNLDPALIGVLGLLTALHLWSLRSRAPRDRRRAAAGWAIACGAFVSPLCALSVALFSARVAQHMVLLLGAAPLIALALPAPPLRSRLWLRGSAGAFFLALWYWHMPRPYDATFTSVYAYWAMHLTLLGSGVFLWRELLNHPKERVMEVLMVGAFTSMQMGFLGAVLTLASRPLFSAHLLTTFTWGLTSLQDQQLGGTLMWIPGMLLFVWAAVRSLERLWRALEA
jgi:putative membrane protein